MRRGGSRIIFKRWAGNVLIADSYLFCCEALPCKKSSFGLPLRISRILQRGRKETNKQETT